MSVVLDVFHAVIESATAERREVFISIILFITVYLFALNKSEIMKDLSKFCYGKNWELYVTAAALMVTIMCVAFTIIDFD